MILRIPKWNRLFLFVVIFFCFIPSSLFVFFLPKEFSYFKYFISILLLFEYYIHRNGRKVELIVIGIIISGVLIVFSSIGNQKSLTPSIGRMIITTGWFLLVRYIILTDKNGEKLSVAVHYFTIICTITTILAFFNPNGLYETNSLYVIRDQSTCFLGNDNASIPIFFISLLFCVALASKNENKYRFFVYNMLNLVIFSLVRKVGTGIFCCLVILFCWWFLSSNRIKRKGNGKKALLIGAVMFILLVVLQVQKYLTSVLYFITNKVKVGREDIWSLSFQQFKEKWIMGHGYGESFDYNTLLYGDAFVRGLVSAGNTHNVILQQLYMGGIVGTILFLFLLVASLKEYDRNEKVKYSFLMIAVFMGIILRSMVEIGSEYFAVYIPFFYYSQYLKNQCGSSKRLI